MNQKYIIYNNRHNTCPYIYFIDFLKKSQNNVYILQYAFNIYIYIYNSIKIYKFQYILIDNQDLLRKYEHKIQLVCRETKKINLLVGFCLFISPCIS